MTYYTHDIDPVAFYIGSSPVAWYWLAYLFGFSLVYISGLRFIKSQALNISPKDFSDYMSYGWISLILGARAGYILFYNLDYYLENPEQVYQIWNGGMSFHGGLIATAVSFWFIAKRKNQSLSLVADIVCLFVPITLAVGRLANFINGELAGRVSYVSWAVIFPRYGDGLPRHPSQLYEAFLEGLLLFAILFYFRSRITKPYFLSSLFLVGYGFFRLVAEFFRSPDPQIGYLAFGLTLGQYFCLLMIVCGLTLLKLTNVSSDLKNKT